MNEIQPQKEIIYAFIDSQNLNLSIRDQGWRLDFYKFKKYLSDKYNIERAYLFLGYIKENKKLYDFLKEAGYKIIFKPIIKDLTNDKIKGNIDAELVLHSMIKFRHYSRAIIITGDGDFYCLIKYLEQKNKLLRLIIPNKYKYSSLLRRFGRDIIFLNKQKEMLKQ